MKLVEYCTNNTHHGTGDVVRRIESERPDVEVVEYGCLGNCGQCFLDAYVLLDGEIVEAATPEELYDKIMEKLDEADHDPFADLPLD